MPRIEEMKGNYCQVEFSKQEFENLLNILRNTDINPELLKQWEYINDIFILGLGKVCKRTA